MSAQSVCGEASRTRKIRVKAWCRSRCGLKVLALRVKSCLRCNSLARNWVRAGACALVVAPCGAHFVKQNAFFAGRDVGARWCACSCCGAVRIFRFLLAGTWERAGAREVRAISFQEASCQTRFFETKVRFLMAGSHALISSCRARQRRLDNRSSKTMAVVATSCLACDSFA